MNSTPWPPGRDCSKRDRQDEMIDKILGSKSAPAYYSARRAWNVLGYFRRPKPEFDVFRQQIRMMWTYLNRVKTLRGRRAKAYILDALRALKLRNPKWKITMRELSIQPNDMEIPWNQIPAPCRATRNHPPDDAREYLTAPAPRVTAGELAAMTMVNEKVWERFHRYQGFRVQDAQENDVHLRAIPVPEGPDSLWHSVSYWLYRRAPTGAEVDGNETELPGSGDRSIFHHWQVKARIWTYFMQVLKNPDHPRWAEYHWLEYQSRNKDRDFGTLSMARSLYAGKAQGAPAFAHQHLLWVIADYFNTQIITFGRGRETPELDVGQYQQPYYYRAFGHRPATSKNPPILLCTDRSHTHYDPVDYDHRPFHNIPPVAPLGSWNDPLQPAANTPAIIPFATTPYEGRLHCPWWPESDQRANNPNPHYPPLEVLHSGHPPCEEARYNYLSDEEQPRVDAFFPNGTIPAGNQLFVPRWAPRTICGVLPHRLGKPAFDDLVLTDDIWDRFKAGLDVPGMMFDVPNEATRQRWEHGGRTGLAVGGVYTAASRPMRMPGFLHVQTEWQWRFGEDPMGEVGVDGVRMPLTSKEMKRGRFTLDDPYLEFGEADRWRLDLGEPAGFFWT